MKYFPVEVGSRGFTNQTLRSCFKFLDLFNKIRKAIDLISQTVLRAIYTIWLARSNKMFGRWELVERPAGEGGSPVLRRYIGTFQKPRTFDVKSTVFLKNPKISTSLFWGFSKTRYFCCRNLGIFTRVKILGYFTRNYRADCDFIRQAEYSWSRIYIASFASVR